MFSKWVNVEIRACKKCRCPLSKISLHYQTVIGQSLTVFYQLFSWTSAELSKCPIDKMIGLQGYLTVWGVPRVPCVRLLQAFKGTSVEMNKFPKKEATKFCKLYDNEEDTQVLLRSEHFINPTVWHQIFGLNFMASILVMISYHKGI